MGYTTEFRGKFNLDKPLTAAHMAYLKAFATGRRMTRDAEKTKLLPDPLREAVLLPVGVDGGYFVNGEGFCGQGHSSDVIDYNVSPSGQPGLWCQWVPSEDGTGIEWDGGEKFYDYVEWIRYVIDNFLEPWGYIVDGSVEWRGEEWDDTGPICVTDNTVEADGE